MNSKQFRMHAFELELCRNRCKPLIKQLSSLPMERQESCNICGSRARAILSDSDRYGYPIRTVMCLKCGLIYNLDRFSYEGYQQFYMAGSYRKLTGLFKNKKSSMDSIRTKQIKYSNSIARALSGYVPQCDGARLLDIGGSSGLVADKIRKEYGLRPTIIDPAEDEIKAARKLDIEAIVSSLEEFETHEKFDLILLCRTVEHLYDLSRTLKKVHSLLKPDGLFFCDVSDYLENCRGYGPPMVVSKIDHTFWLTQESAPRIFRSFGFEVEFMTMTERPDRVGFCFRPTEPQPLKPADWALLQKEIRKLRQIWINWKLYSQKPPGFTDSMRKKAYKLKKKLLK